MKILKAELTANPDSDTFFKIYRDKIKTTKFGLDFEIQIEESDRCTVSTIVDAAEGKIEDRSIFNKAKEKFNMAFEDAMDEFVKRLVSRE